MNRKDQDPTWPPVVERVTIDQWAARRRRRRERWIMTGILLIAAGGMILALELGMMIGP